ncbi:MAG: GNAT family N-acetyltransferase [Acidimicrobiales bacterium]|nr:GNAT family N-acetyltransferase [Acidimicrobiales bacterium]MDG2218857.1 GNAT family N-acetyltransferase [Acidimicrobiales bacterium]
MDVTARRAQAEDLSIVVALAEAAISELTPVRGGSIWSRYEARPEPLASTFDAQIRDNNALVAVGSIDETIVGYAGGHLVELHDGSVMTALSDIYVLPGARGVGVGECLMEWIVDWSRTAGSIGIDSLALPGDRSTKNFFESFGLVARAITVHRSLQ